MPDVSATAEAHLWDHLDDPYPADAGKDARAWMTEGVVAVLILNGATMEVVEQRGVKPTFSKWKFKSSSAAKRFAEMMQTHCTVIGL